MYRAQLFCVLSVALVVGDVSAGIITWKGTDYTTPTEPFFTVPYPAELYLEPFGGSSTVKEFGIGTPALRTNYFTSFGTAVPEVFVGVFAGGSVPNFYMMSDFGGAEYAYSSLYATNLESFITFYDPTRSFAASGSVIAQTSATTWMMNLDDANSYRFDDDDNELLMQIRLVPIPEPSGIVLFGALGVAAFRRRRRSV